MTSTRALVLALALTLALGSSSCRLFRRSAKAVPPPPPPPALSKTSTAPPKPAETPPPPELPPGQPNLGQPLPAQAPKLPAPPKRRASRKVPAKPAPAPPPPEPAPAPEPPPPPVPELAQILTVQQQQEYNQAIDRSIYRAQRNLAALGGRRLNPEQSLAVERIKTFVQQALEARKTDLIRAKSLAERADVLAEDLLRSIQ